MFKPILLFLLVGVLFLSPFGAQAADPPLLSKGPLTIDRTGKFSANYTFSATAGATAVLTITKTTADKAITSGYVTLNYVRTNLPAFPVGGVTVFEKQVTLKASNRLTLSLTGTRGAAITLVVRKTASPTPPTVTLSANPSTINAGAASTLAWTSTNATSITIDNGIGSVALSGTRVVTPNQTTTYTITATGAGGSAGATALVEVKPLPTVQMTCFPHRILPGETAELFWRTWDAETVTIDPGIGIVDPIGDSITLRPETTTTYTITATNSAGTVTTQATVIIGLEGALHVPGHYATIQAAVDAASNGEVVVLADGTYTGAGNRNITAQGKALVVRSATGAQSCIIDGQGGGQGFSSYIPHPKSEREGNFFTTKLLP
jgi:hypothetical protein